MKTRKGFVFGAVVCVAILAFCVSSYAATSGDVCVGCGKTQLGYIPLPVGVGQTQCNAAPFDFDGNPTLMPYGATPGLAPSAVGSYTGFTTGYCDGYNNGVTATQTMDITSTIRNPKLIFQICNCPDPSKLGAGAPIGIRMTILTDGVYWSSPNVTTLLNAANFPGAPAALPADQTRITFSKYRNTTNACKATTYATSDMPVAVPQGPYEFGRVQYYLADGVTKSTPVGTTVCTVPAANRAKVLESVRDTITAGRGNTVYANGTLNGVNSGYDVYFVQNDDVNNQVSDWWIDIPPMRVESSAKAGDHVRVQVQLLNPQSAGICQACLPICECTYDIGIIGCPTSAVTNCVFFPYVVTQAGDWQTGIAIANTSKAAVTNPTLTFEITDAAGKVCKATKAFTDQVSGFMLDGLLNDLTWDKKPAAGAAMMRVTGNFPLDGYEFFTNGTFGAGTQPRQACP